MIQDTIHKAMTFIVEGRLVKALDLLKPIFTQHPKLKDSAEIDNISQALSMMFHYMRQNANDPERHNLYNSLLMRTYQVAADLEISWRCRNIGFYVTQFQKAAHLNMSPDFIRTVLESFVSDIAMLSLNGGDTDEKSKEIYVRHQTFIERLFAAITVSCQWSDGERRFWADLITSPVIDSNDAQVITSAIMLSAMNQFDANKTCALADIYLNAADNTSLKERALIGFVFSLDYNKAPLFPKVKEVLNKVVDSQTSAHELLELQKQIFYCMNAERDKKTIEEEIMPDITNNSPYRVNTNGMVEEKEDDKLRDILHPDADDKAMEQLEQSMEKITNMQKQGADIYFGGFSHMKRFPFFSVAANWFLPYYVEQPEVSKVREKLGNSRFIDLLLTKSSFCESDKYSFTFAVASIIGNMPASIREVISSGEALNFEIPDEEANNPVYIRRQYLQDLYRFFRIHPQRSDLINPFDDDSHSFFFIQDVFLETDIVKQVPSLAVFLHDQKRFKELGIILQKFSEKQKDTLTYWLLSGTYQLHTFDYQSAVHSFTKALEKDPDNEMTLRGQARAAMMCSEYDIADKAYGKLLEIKPGQNSFLVNRGLAQINKGKYDEAAKTIYEADYRYPNDTNVGRVKAWLLIQQHKPDEALGEYKKLTTDKPQPEDWLNMGYALWITHNISEAADSFAKYLSLKPEADLLKEFKEDSKILTGYNLSNDDFLLMEELVTASASQIINK